ncbi:MAG: rRNA (cytidine1402-2-O)-methyltransferase [Actinomycetota bacterium]
MENNLRELSDVNFSLPANSAHLIQAIVDAKYIAAEDSRKFSRLCQELNIRHSAKVISFFEGNESERIEELTKLLTANKDVLVVTDAGAPGISDPGYRLIRAALTAQIQVKVLPGPSAVTTALLLSGLQLHFCYLAYPLTVFVLKVSLQELKVQEVVGLRI